LKKILIILGLLVILATNVFADKFNDVPKGHWAYGAVNTLSEKGYLEGYPSNDFLGDRTLTRYEFAVVIQRILNNLEEKNNAAQNQEINDENTPNSDDSEEIIAEKLADDPESEEAISKLIDEFKVELTIIGTRLDAVEAQLEEIKSKQDNVDVDMYDEEGTVQTLKKDVSDLKKMKFSGYIQTRYADVDDAATMTNGFWFRRARIKGTFTPNSQTELVASLDFGKLTQSSSNNVEVKDFYVKWKPDVKQFFILGQQNVPFGYVISESSSVRETPERPYIAQQLFKGERDRGITYTTESIKNFPITLGMFNGSGPSSAPSNKKFGDLMARVSTEVGDLQLGASYWYSDKSKGVGGLLTDNSKDRFGFDARYYIMNGLTFKGEYMNGKNIDTETPATSMINERINGWYAQLAWTPINKLTFVTNYETISDAYTAFEKGYTAGAGGADVWHLGVMYDLNSNIRLKLFRDLYDGYKTAADKVAGNKWNNDKWIAECVVTF